MNLDTLYPLYKIRDDDAEVRDPWEEDDAEDEVENADDIEEQDDESVVPQSTPGKSVRFDPLNNVQIFLPGESIDSPAKRTRSRQIMVPAETPQSSSSGLPKKSLFRD